MIQRIARWKRRAAYLLSSDWERAWMDASRDSTLAYLIARTRERDAIFHAIEQAVRDRQYAQAISLAERGWQLRGR